MTATRRRYTRKQKTTAVLAAVASSTEAAAEQTGIPRTTNAYWMERPEFVELRQKTRAEHAEGFRVLAAMAMDRLVQLLPTMEPRDLTVLLGVATDKGQLLGGEATERTETRDISSNLDDHEREVLNDAIRGELARRSDERTAEPAVGTAGETGAEGTPR
jgi:hypothetical protein